MTKIKIVTDSSVTIEPELVKQLDITIVPLSVMIDNVVYSDADLKEEGKFLQLMQESKNLPKTSQPPVGVFAEIFEDLCKDGGQILAIHMSHALSGKEMKESLQAYVEKPISVLETGSIIQTHTGENAWAILIRYHS
ncbi:TPA: DegV family protein [Streptococcus pneumoniae]